MTPTVHRIEDWDWTKGPAPMIRSPTVKCFDGRIVRATARFVALSKRRMGDTQGKHGDWWWISTGDRQYLIDTHRPDYIYERLSHPDAYAHDWTSPRMTAPCKDCRGSGEYVGFIHRKECPTCDGNGYI